MKSIFVVLLTLSVCSFVVAQKTEPSKDAKPESSKDAAAAALPTPTDIAKRTLDAHGGEKFRTYKTFIARGSVDVSTAFGGQTQTFPGSFVMTLAGDKYRYEINSIQSFKQVFDGEQTSSSLQNFTLPPINRLGMPLLQKLDEKGYAVTALPDVSANKKKTGFRLTSPEGYFTDFVVDDKTYEVKAYEASYDFNGRSVTTSVEIDKWRIIDGVKLPEKYAQRFELGFGTFYADFKSKEMFLNNEVADDVFKLSK